jgi:hypothetical protein
MKRMSENEKRTIACPKCSASPGHPCKGSRIPGPSTFGGGWGGPPDLDRAHEQRRAAIIASRS